VYHPVHAGLLSRNLTWDYKPASIHCYHNGEEQGAFSGQDPRVLFHEGKLEIQFGTTIGGYKWMNIPYELMDYAKFDGDRNQDFKFSLTFLVKKPLRYCWGGFRASNNGRALFHDYSKKNDIGESKQKGRYMDNTNSEMSKLREVIGKCTGKNVIKVIAGKKVIREHTTEQECRDAGCEWVRRGKIIKNYPSQPLSGTASPTGSRVTSDNIRQLDADMTRALHRFKKSVDTYSLPNNQPAPGSYTQPSGGLYQQPPYSPGHSYRYGLGGAPRGAPSRGRHTATTEGGRDLGRL